MGNNETPFFQKASAIVCKNPFGKASTFGAIAHVLGNKGSTRMVRWAMNASHALENMILAHRVVNKNGMLAGKHHFFSTDRIQSMLEQEGIAIKEDKIINFNLHFWDPLIELNQ